jgi:hypothetical protein
MSLKGRPLPTTDVGYPFAQLGGQLSGGEIAPPTGAGRPVAVLRGARFGATNRPFSYGTLVDGIVGMAVARAQPAAAREFSHVITRRAVQSRRAKLCLA